MCGRHCLIHAQSCLVNWIRGSTRFLWPVICEIRIIVNCMSNDSQLWGQNWGAYASKNLQAERLVSTINWARYQTKFPQLVMKVQRSLMDLHRHRSQFTTRLTCIHFQLEYMKYFTLRNRSRINMLYDAKSNGNLQQNKADEIQLISVHCH